MVQLASCPHCDNQFVLPDTDDFGVHAECPACHRGVALVELNIRRLAEAKFATPPAAPEPVANEPVANIDDDINDDTVDVIGNLAASTEPLQSDETLPFGGQISSGGSTLASFLREAQLKTSSASESAASETRDEDVSATRVKHSTLSDFVTDQSTSRRTNDVAMRFDQSADDEPSPSRDRPNSLLDDVVDLGSMTDNDSEGSFDFDDVEGNSTIDFLPARAAAAAELHEPDRSTGNKPETPNEQPNRPLFDFQVDDTVRATNEKTVDAPIERMPSDGAPIQQEIAERFDYEPEDSQGTIDFDAPLAVDDGDTDAAFSSLETTDDHEEEEFSAVGAPRGVVARPRKSGGSMIRQMVGVAGGGVVGIAVGYLMLLWIFHFIGRTDDPLSVAGYYPDVILPAGLQDGKNGGPADSGMATTTPQEDVNTTPDSSGADAEDETSRVEQATHVEPLPPEPLVETDDMAPLAEFEAAVQPVRILASPSYTRGELEELTQFAKEATEGLLAGQFSDTSTRRPKAHSYANIAKLADALTFAKKGTSASMKDEARSVFPPLFASERHRQEIALIASYWVQSPERKHGGVFFCGAPDTGSQQGSVVEYRFTLPKGEVVLPAGETMTVVTAQPLAGDLTVAASVGVVGSLIEDPAANIEGYTGSANRVVWSNNLFPAGE